MAPLPTPPGPVAEEATCRLFLNDREIASLQCTPADLKELAVGYLFSSARISAMSQIQSVEVGGDDTDWTVRVAARAPVSAESENGPSDSPPAAGRLVLSLDQLQKAARIIMEEGPLRRETGGVHSAGALFPDGGTILWEDVSRHCALDKAIGGAAASGGLDRVVLLSSGRAALELVQKSVSVGVQIFASRGIPTTPAYRLACLSDITLVGSILSAHPVIYTGGDRIKPH